MAARRHGGAANLTSPLWGGRKIRAKRRIFRVGESGAGTPTRKMLRIFRPPPKGEALCHHLFKPPRALVLEAGRAAPPAPRNRQHLPSARAAPSAPASHAPAPACRRRRCATPASARA